MNTAPAEPAEPTGSDPTGNDPTGGDPTVLAQRVAAAVLANPSVAALHGGPYSAVATHLSGRRLLGVRIGTRNEPVEVAVVLRPDRPIPEVVRALRREVSRICGGAAVDITVADLAIETDAR